MVRISKSQDDKEPIVRGSRLVPCGETRYESLGSTLAVGFLYLNIMENNRSRQSKVAQAFRWMAILPAAALSMVAATFLTNMMLTFQLAYIGATPDSWFALIQTWVVGPALSAGAFVYFGSKTAPSNRKIVSLILGAILVIMVTVGVISTISIDGEILKMILTAIASIIAGGYIVYSFFENGDEFDAFNESHSTSKKLVSSFVEHDSLFEEAKQLVLRERNASISFLMQELRIGNSRAEGIRKELEDAGTISIIEYGTNPK